jgi:SAM-dependent methyltransferase
MTDPGPRWARALQEWAIPSEILAHAPESPWGFPPALFAGDHAHADTPSTRAALEALPPGGSVLDVGVGAGAASLPLMRSASLVTGVDQSTAMLAAFAASADARGVAHREVQGTWPEVAPDAGIADVVVCHHVFYNVAALAPFARALTAAARRRVVVEVTEIHPATTMNSLWLHFHGLERPYGPTWEEARGVLVEAGLQVKHELWRRPPRPHRARRADVVAFLRRRLCLPAERDPEIGELIGDDLVWSPRAVATMWWEGGASAG